MKIYFDTLGCPKNFYDTDAAKYLLETEGYTMTDDPEDSDVIIVNTCGFIDDAKRESIQRILELADSKKDKQKLVVSGCLSKRFASDLKEEMPEVDLFIGVNEYGRLPELLKEMPETKVDISETYDSFLPFLKRDLGEHPYTATLKIAEGCDNRCAYCAIPYIRGGYRSKKKEDVLEEARYLASSGVKELILIAEDLTNYGTDIYDSYRLANLLRELVKVDGIEWIRLMYCYEDRITDDLISVMAKEPKICHYIDVPIQHSSDKVLKEMRRRSTGESIRTTMAKLRKAMPDITIRTTLIVGFPGETDEDFADLMDFVRTQKFQRLGVFSYSQEEGTPAGDREDQIPEDIKQERLDMVMMAQMEISNEHNAALVGRTLKVMVDSSEEDGSYVGRTMYDAPEIDDSVLFTSRRDLRPGDIVNVLIEDAFDYDLTGTETEEEIK
ncbi:MAG: 30S ribosomal protein S12 methylthiotransferase RimO [Firmicutes bacterium]|nr:30S ribosomal protein S12 methylthiotransferase RimO [Bacillota bacterium]